MNIKILDTVVLMKDIPERCLKRGDLGTVVELYEPDGVEVEFVTGSGSTRALVTMKRSDVRNTTSTDVLAVRSDTAA